METYILFQGSAALYHFTVVRVAGLNSNSVLGNAPVRVSSLPRHLPQKSLTS